MDTTCRPATILVVDGYPPIVRLLQYHLGRQGFRVLGAFDGYEALGKAEAHRPAVIIMDLTLPGLDGCEAIARIKPGRPEVIAIALTARDPATNALRAWNAGFDLFVEKPFNPRELIAIIRRELAAQRRADEELARATGSN